MPLRNAPAESGKFRPFKPRLQRSEFGLGRMELEKGGREVDLKLTSRLLSSPYPSQDDLTRLETLSTTHRTLNYDYELLIKKHKSVAEEAAGAERKEQAVKSQLKSVPPF